MDPQEFAAGHVFFRPGDAGDVAYVLQEGSVELLTGAAEPFTRVGLFLPGDVFGEMALIEERPLAFTARAVTVGKARPMSRDAFEPHLQHDPPSTRQYLRSLFERLRSLTARLGGKMETALMKLPATPAEEPGGPVRSEFLVAQGTPSEWTVIGSRMSPFQFRVTVAQGAAS